MSAADLSRVRTAAGRSGGLTPASRHDVLELTKPANPASLGGAAAARTPPRAPIAEAGVAGVLPVPRSDPSGFTGLAREAVLALVGSTRAAQELPPTVTDPAALSRIAALIQSQRADIGAPRPSSGRVEVQR